MLRQAIALSVMIMSVKGAYHQNGASKSQTERGAGIKVLDSCPEKPAAHEGMDDPNDDTRITTIKTE